MGQYEDTSSNVLVLGMWVTAKKMKFSVKDSFSKCGFGHTYGRNP